MNASVEQRARTGEPSPGSLGGGSAGFAESNRSQARRLPRTARQTLLRLENLAALDFNAASARSAQLFYRRHFSANPFGFAAQRGVLQNYGAVLTESG